MPPYSIPQIQKQIVDEDIKDILEKDIIEPSNNPCSVPVSLVKKNDGSVRFCVDYLRLDVEMIPDRFPTLLIKDIVNSIGKAKYLTLDLLSGYWQMAVAESFKPLTVFSTHSGHYLIRYRLGHGTVCQPSSNS